MEQVYVFVWGFFTATRVIPHLGHLPGLLLTTSGCMGQVYMVCCAVSVLAFLACAKSMGEPIKSARDNMIKFFIFLNIF
jgi:hypothetical protein